MFNHLLRIVFAASGLTMAVGAFGQEAGRIDGFGPNIADDRTLDVSLGVLSEQIARLNSPESDVFAARAEELAPYAGHSVALDATRGTVYFAPNGADFVVVATLDSDGRIVRIVTTLESGQTTKISTPGASGGNEAAVELRRQGDRVFVDDHPRLARVTPLATGAAAQPGS